LVCYTVQGVHYPNNSISQAHLKEMLNKHSSSRLRKCPSSARCWAWTTFVTIVWSKVQVSKLTTDEIHGWLLKYNIFSPCIVDSQSIKSITI
jgi:hypothetical protein